MSQYLTLELRRTVRDKRYLALVVGWPVAAYLLFSTVFASAADAAEGLPSKVAIMVAMASFGAMGGVLMGSGARLAYDRQTGWLRQLSLTPLSGRRVLAVRVLAAMALSLPAILITFVVAALVRNVGLAPWEWSAMVGVLVLGCIPFAAMGLIVGCLADGDSAQTVSSILYLVLAALGGLWMPASIMPAPLQTVAHILPSNHLAQLAWAVARGEAPQAADMAVLLAWFIGAAVIAAFAARRLRQRA
ncbi:MAG: ABC transporter permease [Candidatus Dormibacteraeota bacterium]|nr:ABC transporter permease [Candidatus Dormibacteraeota bacterium]MBV9525912.1 ABC transporter permease [Candidatus Dormibacteraeota bacterium]